MKSDTPGFFFCETATSFGSTKWKSDTADACRRRDHRTLIAITIAYSAKPIGVSGKSLCSLRDCTLPLLLLFLLTRYPKCCTPSME